MKELVISEKSTTAKELVNGLCSLGANFEKHFDGRIGYYESDSVVVAPLSGHLFSLYDIENYLPDEKKWRMEILPFVPDGFKYKITTDEKGFCKNQFELINKLLQREDIGKVVHFGDPDREGELIVRILLHQARNKKPVTRMLTESILPEPIVEAYNNQQPLSDYDNILEEGKARQYMDWLFGINLTRYLTIKTGVLLPVGRVLVPIVKYIYDREKKIKDFKIEEFFAVEGVVKKDGESFYALRNNDLQFEPDERQKAETALTAMQGKKAMVEDIKIKNVKLSPYRLFAGLGLQSFLNNTYSISMDDSMAAMQFLYDNGYITYPRTQTEYVLENEKPAIKKTVDALISMGIPLEFHEDKSIFDNAKCVGEGHTALCITNKIPSSDTMSKWSEIQNLVYIAVFNRFVSNFFSVSPIIEHTDVVLDVNGYKYNLHGEKVLEKGFLKFEERAIKKTLPMLSVGDALDTEFRIIEKETTPPSHVTISELNNYLQNPFKKRVKGSPTLDDDAEFYEQLKEGCSIGTIATITSIIGKAQKDEYISIKGKSYRIEEKGKYLISILDEQNINLYAEKTVDLNKMLVQVRDGKITVSDVLDTTSAELKQIIRRDSTITAPTGALAKKTGNYKQNIVGICPKCGKDVVETTKGFSCVGYKDSPQCKFSMWKEEKFFEWKGKSLTAAIAKALLKSGKIKMKGLKNKDGGSYDATVTVDFSGQYPKYDTTI